MHNDDKKTDAFNLIHSITSISTKGKRLSRETMIADAVSRRRMMLSKDLCLFCEQFLHSLALMYTVLATMFSNSMSSSLKDVCE